MEQNRQKYDVKKMFFKPQKPQKWGSLMVLLHKFTKHSTVWLHRESSICSQKSWEAFLGSYYKIYIILRHGELEFCKYIDKSSF